MAFSSQTSSSSDKSQFYKDRIRELALSMSETSSTSHLQLVPKKEQFEYIQDEFSKEVRAPPNTPSMAGLMDDALQSWKDGQQIGGIHLPPPDLLERRLLASDGRKALETAECCSTLRIDTSKIHTSDHHIWDTNTEIDSSPQEAYQFSKGNLARSWEDGSQSSSPHMATVDSITRGGSEDLVMDVLETNKLQSPSNGNECGSTGPEDKMMDDAITNVDGLDNNQDGAGFKKVIEVWDEQTSKYRIVESLKVETNDSLSQYDFIVRDYVDRNTKETTTYIDVKSELLRNILRVVLRTVRSISVMEEKPSVEQNVLFHFIPELEEHLAKPEENITSTKPLTILVNYLRDAYGSTMERLTALISAGQITYDILWTLFKPGCIVYTTCHGSGKPRGVIFDAGEERINDDQLYYQLECRFIDYDGRSFGEAGIVLGIMKFRGAQPIDSLAAFPLQYHPDHDEVRRDLISCGQKFCDMTSQIADIASRKLNGREIQNLVMLANAVATAENKPISYQHLVFVATSNDKFMEEFNKSDLMDMYT